MTKMNNCNPECYDKDIHVAHANSTCFQDEYDQYITDANHILAYTENLDEYIEHTLRLGIHILEKYRHCIQELDFYKFKFTPILPKDLEMSNIKKCFIGKCYCGQLLIEDKDRCCPKCNQFIFWPKHV